MPEIPIVLIGHKDHGKSTLIGRLLLDTKSVKESRWQEVKEVDESDGRKFELAHLVDSFREEREREMTMDTTRALLKGRERNYQLIDVPGHAELISNMLTGASNAEAALLVVSIEEGIKEQTRQHLEIAKLLGIEQLEVVVNKMDSVGFKQLVFEKMKRKIETILKEIGYDSEKIQFFPVSARERDNVVARSKLTPWYKGPTIMEFLEKMKKPESREDMPHKFICQDNYSDSIVGWEEDGTLKVGLKSIILPQKKECRIESIKDSEGDLKKLKPGQTGGITIRVLGQSLQKNDIERGVVIASDNSDLLVKNILSGEIFWIDKPGCQKLIVECGTASVNGVLLSPPTVIAGTKSPYQINLGSPIVTDPTGKTILGKIVLKDKGKIIAVGNVL